MGQYRGTRVDDGEWVKGYHCVVEEKHYIIPVDAKLDYDEAFNEYTLLDALIEVIPESVGQSTGLKDKAGVEIWKDDLIKAVDEILRVAWHFNRWVMMDDKGRIKEFRQIDQGFYEVIGNATDDEKLLEKQEKSLQ